MRKIRQITCGIHGGCDAHLRIELVPNGVQTVVRVQPRRLSHDARPVPLCRVKSPGFAICIQGALFLWSVSSDPSFQSVSSVWNGLSAWSVLRVFEVFKVFGVF